MAPKTASRTSKSKRSTKRKTTSKRAGGTSSRDALLKKILVAVGGGSGSKSRGSGSMSYQRPGLVVPYPTQTQAEYLEEHTVDGRPFVRMVCPPGKYPNYKDKKCEDGFLYNNRCPKDAFWNPFKGVCSKTAVEAELGYRWNDKNNVDNIGVPFTNNAWAHGQTLPLSNWGNKYWPASGPAPPLETLTELAYLPTPTPSVGHRTPPSSRTSEVPALLDDPVPMTGVGPSVGPWYGV